MLRRFHERGNDFRRTPVYRRQPDPLPDDVVDYLKSNLHADRFLSTRERCSIIQEKFDFYMTKRRLIKTFHRLGIKYSKAKTVYKARLARPDWRRNERIAFCKKITSLLLQGKDVIFADETSTSLWGTTLSTKTWMHEDQAIHHAINTTRGSNLTIMGAVGNCIPNLVFKIYDNTTTETFTDFMIHLKG